MKLPLNCIVNYHEDFLSPDEATTLYDSLLRDYQLDKARLTVEVGGRKFKTDSFKILFATDRLIQKNHYPESVHGKSHLWTGPMAELKKKVEAFTNKEFEVAMCLYYPDGEFFAPYHFDQETSGYATTLPSISLGAVREFSFKENETERVYSLPLANGSLICMADYCQSRYTHSLPKDPQCKTGRINITFREPAFK